MIKLKALNPHWLENMDEPDYDLCVHSCVRLKIKDVSVSDKDLGDWTISASAYLFLKSLREDHLTDRHEQLLPCCGFNFWRAENTFIFGNCGNGINWDIRHENERIIHKFSDERHIEVEYAAWREAVVKFADVVLNFYKDSPPRKFSDEIRESEYKVFLADFTRLYKQFA